MEIKIFRSVSLIIFAVAITSFTLNPIVDIRFPYQEAGLTDRQAAAHLLSRFTFGARPGDVDYVLKVGLEKWLQEQLEGKLPDEKLSERLKSFDLLSLSNKEIALQFPAEGQIRQMAIQDGFLLKDSIPKLEKKELLRKLNEYRAQKGFHQEHELINQFTDQKIITAALSKNQLHQVLTDFWFNHFNVSMTKDQSKRFIPDYERKAIRPHTVGKFEDLLLATAKSPAMLLYLDNAVSVGENEDLQKKIEHIRQRKQENKKNKPQRDSLQRASSKKRSAGLNENYAREVMELHTLGVDGGYSQNDVTEAARVLTGWTIYPVGNNGQFADLKRVIERVGEDRLSKNGFVHEGDFLFASNRHDSKPKQVLGHAFNEGGYQEGKDLLILLARHPSTAKFISQKLATRFVNDNPPKSLIDKMAKTFLDTQGDISKVLITMAYAPEFWNTESIRSKIKSPFEYVISAVRSLDAEIINPGSLNQWITRMGQKMYYYQAPTGFPDRGQYWINSGSLLNRMNFGLAIASKRIKGVVVDLAALTNHQEPESAEVALSVYAKLLLPERNLDQTIQRLMPLVTQPEIQENIEKANVRKGDSTDQVMKEHVAEGNGMRRDQPKVIKPKTNFGDNKMLAQVVGIIIGSPEFQRR